jgi:hypothetical protein
MICDFSANMAARAAAGLTGSTAIPFPQHTPAPEALRRPQLPGQIPTSAKPLARKFEIMTTETNKSGEIYVKVAGTLMVLLLAYGALTLLGVVR